MNNRKKTTSELVEELEQLETELSKSAIEKTKLQQTIQKLKAIIKQLSSDRIKDKNVEEMRRRYEFIANNAKEFMTLINRDYVYEAANDSYCLAHGKKREEIIGKTVVSLWGEEVFYGTIKRNLDICFSGKEVNYEEWFSFPALGRHCFNVRYYPYYDKEATVTHTVVVTHDITQRKLAEEELKKHKEQLSEMVKTRTIELEKSNLQLQTEILERKQLEEKKEKLIFDLKEALSNVKRLRGLVPICANCKKIRDDKGYWEEVESYLRDHSEVEFTHGLCPECILALYPEYHKNRNSTSNVPKQPDTPTRNEPASSPDKKPISPKKDPKNNENSDQGEEPNESTTCS
jgi:PAS domain S-box-containing protein